ncbi:hypothetical protein V1520DRAFT_342110 [Lipomyces starkeyi]
MYFVLQFSTFFALLMLQEHCCLTEVTCTAGARCLEPEDVEPIFDKCIKWQPNDRHCHPRVAEHLSHFIGMILCLRGRTKVESKQCETKPSLLQPEHISYKMHIGYQSRQRSTTEVFMYPTLPSLIGILCLYLISPVWTKMLRIQYRNLVYRVGQQS